MRLFLILLQVLFIGLKLCNVIAWSWLAVMAPLWVPALIATGVFLISAITTVVICVKKINKSNKSFDKIKTGTR